MTSEMRLWSVLGADSCFSILLTTRNGNQQESNIVAVAPVAKVSACRSTRVLTAQFERDRSPAQCKPLTKL